MLDSPVSRVIGIDLGTTNCCVAVVQDGKPVVLANRDVVRPGHRARLALRREQHRRHQIEPEAREIDQVVARERLVEEVCVHQPERPESAVGGAQPPDVR